MANILRNLLSAMSHRRSLRRWGRVLNMAETMDLGMLRVMRTRARQIRRLIDQVTLVADARLTQPVLGANPIPRPLHSDWAYRPELWRGPVSPIGLAAPQSKARIGDEVSLHHDCARADIALRQIRNTRADDLAPFGLRLEVFAFDGSFLSLVIELPAEAHAGLLRQHVLRLECMIAAELPIEVFARLNVRHGPNTDQIVRSIAAADMGEQVVEFDLAYTKINERRVEAMWIDLIMEKPAMNMITLRDVTITRRPRAGL